MHIKIFNEECGHLKAYKISFDVYTRQIQWRFFFTIERESSHLKAYKGYKIASMHIEANTMEIVANYWDIRDTKGL